MSNLIFPCMIAVIMLVMAIIGQPQPYTQFYNNTCIMANKRLFYVCCKMPLNSEKTVHRQCTAENPKPKGAPATGTKKTEGSCVTQCFLTTAKAFQNNTIDKEAARRSLQPTFGSDVNFSPQLDGIVDQCHSLVSSDANLKKVVPVSADPGRVACSFVPEAFFNCLTSKYVLSCPTAAWTNSDDCVKLKQKLAAGCPTTSQLKNKTIV